MQLPGGVVEDGVRRRDWAFRPVTGSLELALAEAGEHAACMPQAVTHALGIALDYLAGCEPTWKRVAELCVADRQYLMRELEHHLGDSGGWFHSCCRHCGVTFDFHLDYSDLPVREAGAGYPLAQVELDGRLHEFRLPNGADQEKLATLPDEDAPDWLLRHLAKEPQYLAELDAEVVAAIEAALESVSPKVVGGVEAVCPDCAGKNIVDLDPYRVLGRHSDALLLEVHQIAAHYHWSEADILALPRARRQRYLQMIDRARGMAV